MPQPLPRYRPPPVRELEKVDRVVAQTAEPEGAEGVTAPGDWRRLRGVPCLGRGVRGAIAGTVPPQRLT